MSGGIESHRPLDGPTKISANVIVEADYGNAN